MVMQNKYIARKLLLGMAALSVVSAPIATLADRAVAATSASAITSVAQVVKPIYATSKSYFNLVDVTLAPSDDGQIASFTMGINNNDSKSLDLSDYWFRLANKSGSTYSMKMSTEDAKLTSVAPNSKVYITLYAKVSESTKLEDLLFKVVKFDFSVAGYEKALGQFSFPKNYTNNVASTSYKSIYLNNTMLYTKISAASIGQSGDNNLATINFVYNNVGKKAITISKYKYYVVTSSGLMYEATPTDTSDLVMAPLQRTEVQLTASIPTKVSTSGWRLIVERDNGGDTNVQLPVGAYNLKFGGTTTNTNATDTFQYASTNGTYEYKLLQVQREPWENQDVLAARIRITNKSTNSLSVPNITGYFYLDNKVQVDFKTVATNNQLGLNPNGYVDVDVYAKMPSNYQFSSVKLVVNNKVDDKTTTKAGELASTSFLSKIPVIAVDSSYGITRDGSQMTGALSAVNVYNNSTSKIYSVQMTLTSSEKRTIDPVKLVGVFVNDDNGDIFPATATYGEGKVNPTNKALVNFSAALPQNYSSGNLRLIVGEAVADTKYASGTTAAEGYVNAVEYNLPQEQRTSSTMNQIMMLPYSLTINKFTPNVLGQEVNLKLDYTLDKDMSYNVYPTDRKWTLAIEGVNPNDGTVYTYFTKEITMEGDGDSALQPGKNKIITLKYPFEYNGIDGSLKFTAKLYESVQGSKKLIAERSFYWLTENDWTSSATTN